MRAMAYYAHSRPELLEQIEQKADNVVLDVGCGVGELCSELRLSGRAREVWGVELVPEIAERAGANPDLTKVYCGDISTIVYDLPQSYFSHVIAGDVLEHLVDPWSTLERLRAVMRRDGRIVASVPNIRNLSFILQLLFRRTFKYKDSGVLDRSHLRFFARKDLYDLFASAGFEDIRIRHARPKRNLFNRIAKALFGDLAVKVFLVTERSAAGNGR